VYPVRCSQAIICKMTLVFLNLCVGSHILCLYSNQEKYHFLKYLKIGCCYGAFGIEVGIPLFVPTFLHFLNLLSSPRYRSHVMINVARC
jgi:hypothetical protein